MARNMRDFMWAVIGLVVLAATVSAWTSCSYRSAGQDLEGILQGGSYCTASTQKECAGKRYIVRGPDDPTIVEALQSADLTNYVHADACFAGAWILADIDGKLWGYCHLVTDPTSFSEDEKLTEIEQTFRDERSDRWRSPIADPEIPQMSLPKRFLALLRMSNEIDKIEPESADDRPKSGGY
jgi:hypothetical protein